MTMTWKVFAAPLKKLALVTTALALVTTSSRVFAGEQVRVAWDKNPHSEAVIGFAAAAGTSIRVGTGTDESSWQSHTATVQRQFDNSPNLSSHFVRLDNLTADSEYYFKICGSSCSSQLYYFKTAPDSPRNMTVISGGDSRSSIDGRLEGNRLVAKIRPDYITFGGDYTNTNDAVDVSIWLDHWQETFSIDQIDGKTFHRVYPIIPTFGNHEASNPNTLCEAFGIDPDGNGVCSSRDNYFALSVGGNQTRIYTLNTEFKDDATRWSLQKDWLINDLANQGAQASWRLGQYHRSMIPSGGGKTAFATIFEWATIFADGKMNLITESDTHIVKYTWPVLPGGSSYTRADAGTVYLGEGSWGVSPRTTDTPPEWLADNASFKQFKLIQFNGNDIEVSTVRFSGEPGTASLTRAQRQADPLTLPDGLDLWNPSGSVEEIYTLSRAANQLTRVGTGSNQPPQAAFDHSADKWQVSFNNHSSDPENAAMTYHWHFGDGIISAATHPSHTYAADGSYTVTLTATDAQGLSHSHSRLVTVMADSGTTGLENGVAKTSLSAAGGETLKFFFTVPDHADNLQFVTGGGSGDMDLYVRYGAQPTTQVYDCRPYLYGNNESCSPAVQSGTYYVMLRAYTAFSGVSLTASYDDTGSNPGGTYSVADLSGNSGDWRYFSIDIASGMSSLTVDISGTNGDADLYVRRGSQPTTSSYDCRPYTSSSSENCAFDNPAADIWYLGVRAWENYQGVTLNAVWQP